MTKEELSEIYALNQEIKMWRKELDRIKNKSLIGCPNMNSVSFSGGISDKTGDTAIIITDIEKIIVDLMKDIEAQRKKIITYISSVDNSQVRQILFLRHVDCLGWWKVARIVGGNNTADSVRMAHDRFLTGA